MGIVRTSERRKVELEEINRMLLHTVSFDGGIEKGGDGQRLGTMEEKLVCVTSGISYLGFAIVNKLLHKGYSIRLAVENQEDLEKLRETETFVERISNRVSVVIAKVTDSESLCEAFNGCRGVFHTSSFADPCGVSGYSKHMADLEIRATEKVMEACARTPTVRRCVLTSSLLACIWRNHSLNNLPSILDENCWSDDTICREKKLWFALGKTMAEKAAWRAARETNLKLATICPGLIIGPGIPQRNSTGSIAYLKGAQDMYAEGLLATVDVSKVADAHVRVYEAMVNGSCGRYICFDRVITAGEEAIQLEHQMGMLNRIAGEVASDSPRPLELCNRKLFRLMSMPAPCSTEV